MKIFQKKEKITENDFKDCESRYLYSLITYPGEEKFFLL